eukprot:COSAG02_NODE_7670_length_2901_cov_60.433262_3_plen_198_part_00
MDLRGAMKPSSGSNEFRAAEAVDRSPAINLPGTTANDADESIDIQTQKIEHLRTMRQRKASNLRLAETTSKATNSSSKWNKARSAVRAQSALTGRMLALRNLVGTDEGSATIEETEEMLRKEKLMQRANWYIVMPDSSFKMCWDLSQVVVLLYVAAVVPLRIGFDTTSEPFSTFWWIEVFIDIYFFVDVCHCKRLAL